MSNNNFLPFCPTDTGTNLLSQVDYAADAQRTIGNQPGVARSKLVNKAARQSAFVTSQIAQSISDSLSEDVLDDGVTATLLSQINRAFARRGFLQPNIQKFLTSTGTYGLSYYFSITAGNATSGATYTNNSQTFTVVNTISAGTLLLCTSTGAPSASGTLTKATGTGDSTITFQYIYKPTRLEISLVGGGGGGGGSGNTGTAGTGGAGGNTTFGTSLLLATGGGGGAQGPGGSGGTTTTVGTIGIGFPGGSGGTGWVQSVATVDATGGDGGNSIFGGGGGGAFGGFGPNAGATNTGGGGGGNGNGGTANQTSGGGGGAGSGILKSIITNPSATYAFAVGAGGAGGTVGTAGVGPGAAGAAGCIVVTEYFV